MPLSEAMRIRGKLENYDRVDEVLEELIASLPEGEVQRKVEAKSIFKELKEKVLRDEVLEHGVRLDGRKFDEIRAIWSEVGVLPRVHGSAVFTRGETQALVTARSARPTISRRSRPSRATATSASCSTTTSRRSRSAKWRSCAGPAAAKSATARSPSARSRRSCRPKTSSRTPFASCPTSSSRTARRRWRRSAAARWR